MYKILDICFEGKIQINFKEFQRINEEIASDMLLSVLNILREKLPCSENFGAIRETMSYTCRTPSNNQCNRPCNSPATTRSPL